MADRTEVFEALSGLLRPYADFLTIKSDTPTNLYLESQTLSAKPQMFAAVQAKASYVALHVYPVYLRPELLDGISAQLRARMQGKSCFNFKSLEQIPQQEVVALLRSAYESAAAGIVQPNPACNLEVRE